MYKLFKLARKYKETYYIAVKHINRASKIQENIYVISGQESKDLGLSGMIDIGGGLDKVLDQQYSELTYVRSQAKKQLELLKDYEKGVLDSCKML